MDTIYSRLVKLGPKGKQASYSPVGVFFVVIYILHHNSATTNHSLSILSVWSHQSVSLKITKKQIKDYRTKTVAVYREKTNEPTDQPTNRPTRLFCFIKQTSSWAGCRPAHSIWPIRSMGIGNLTVLFLTSQNSAFVAKKTAEIQGFYVFSKWPPIQLPCGIGNVTLLLRTSQRCYIPIFAMIGQKLWPCIENKQTNQQINQPTDHHGFSAL